MKVRFLQNIAGSGFRFVKGGEADLPEVRAKEYIAAGYCEAIAEPPAKRMKKAVSSKKETR